MSRAKPLPSWTNLTTVSMPGLMTEPVTKWIVLIENQGGFDVDVSRALDAGVDLAIHNFNRSFEDAPHEFGQGGI